MLKFIARTKAPEPRVTAISPARVAGVGARLEARARRARRRARLFCRTAFPRGRDAIRVPAPGVDLHLDALTAEGGT